MKLWKLLIDREMNKQDLKRVCNISSASVAKIGKCENFTTDCTIEIVLHLLMAHFDMTEEQVQAEIDSYFEIVDWIDKHRDTREEDLGYAKKP